VVATNEPLREAVEARRFRPDLYYRLQVLTILLPPLRDRKDDIAPLAASLLPRGASLSPSALQELLEYPWPGNIRELRNTLWRASILSDGAPIRAEHLGLSAAASAASADSTSMSLADAERRAIQAALAASDGNRTKAAALLGVARSTLIEKLKRHPELS
jgi:DNA-binding NtrC family response regulator